MLDLTLKRVKILRFEDIAQVKEEDGKKKNAECESEASRERENR